MNPLKHLSFTVRVLISRADKKQINSVFTGLLKKNRRGVGGAAALYGAGFGPEVVNVTPTKIKNSSGKSQNAFAEHLCCISTRHSVQINHHKLCLKEEKCSVQVRRSCFTFICAKPE